MTEESKIVYTTEDGMRFDTKQEALEWETFLNAPKVYLIYKSQYHSSSDDKYIVYATTDKNKAVNEERRLLSDEQEKSYHTRYTYEIKSVVLN